MDVFATYQDQMAAYGFVPANHEKPVYFPVQGGGLFDEKGKPVPGWQRIYRADNDQTLAVHTDKYELRPYEETFAQFDEAIELSNLSTVGMQVMTDLTHNGARCFRQYVLPEHTVEFAQGQHLALRIIAIDSYDGTYAANLMAGGYEFVCANTSVIGRHIIQLRVKHTRGAAAKFVDGIERVMQAAESFVAHGERIGGWHNRALQVENFHALVGTMAGATQRTVEHLTSRYATEVHSPTLLAAWQLLTSWSTHGEMGRQGDNRAQGRTECERRVAALIDSPPWRRLEDG